MRVIVLLLAWILSILALAAAVMTGIPALNGHPLLWIGVAAGVIFALVANPLTSGVLGFRGKPAKTFVAYLVLVGLGAGSVYLDMRQRSSPEYLRAQGSLPQLINQLDYTDDSGAKYRILSYASPEDVAVEAGGVRSMHYVEYRILSGSSVDKSGRILPIHVQRNIDCIGKRIQMVPADAAERVLYRGWLPLDPKGQSGFLLEFACATESERAAHGQDGRWPFVNEADPAKDATRRLCEPGLQTNWNEDQQSAYLRLCRAR